MSKNYIQDALRTENQDYKNIIQRLNNMQHSVYASVVISQITELADKLDQWKKYAFYGKSLADLQSNTPKNCDIKYKIPLHFQHYAINNVKIARLVHGSVGLVTEAVEFLDGVLHGIQEGILNETNLKEEIGDVFWYLAQLCDELGLSFEECQHANINKLKTRYPNKFTQADAINRKLDAEVEALNKKN